MSDPRDRIDELEARLQRARVRADVVDEIRCLVDIADGAREIDDFALESRRLDVAEERIRQTGCARELLPRVLGARGRLLRRTDRLDESLALYEAATEAARDISDRGAEALWMGKQGQIRRVRGELDDAEACFRSAHAIFAALGDGGLGGLADQEGSLGLIAQARGDRDEALRRYRRAVELAGRAGDLRALASWSRSQANELGRRRLHAQARTVLERAFRQIAEGGDEPRIFAAATSLADAELRAARPLRASHVLIEAAERLSKPALTLELLRRALPGLQIFERRDRMAAVLARVDEIGRAAGPDVEASLGEFRPFAEFVGYDGALDVESASDAADRERAPTSFERFVVEAMERAEKEGDVDAMKHLAELVCDVHCALATPSREGWARFVSDPLLPYQVIADATRALTDAMRARESLEISQRFKGAGFRLARLHEVRDRLERSPEVERLLTAQRALEAAIAPLARRDARRARAAVAAAREAGERLLEASALLRTKDRLLDAALGGLVEPDALIDALPAEDASAVCDFVTGRDGTVVHTLIRVGRHVIVRAHFAAGFTWTHYGEVMQDLVASGYTREVSPGQRRALQRMGAALHDGILCDLAKGLSREGVTRLVLVPDAFLQSLPLGLARSCASEVQEPSLESGAEHLLSEVFPIEYAPCLQAIAVSQHQRRPRAIAKIVVAADPESGATGSYLAAHDVAHQLANGTGVSLVSLAGEQATLDRFLVEVRDADIVVLGARGHFDPRDPSGSSLRLHDAPWTIERMLRDPPFARSPVVILSACEVGAVEPAGDAARSGIPGALISAGAACVVASTWPLCDVAAGHMAARLVQYLAHPEYRPAAALFAALRDLRSWEREAIVLHTSGVLERMERDGSAARSPGAFRLVEDAHAATLASGDPHPLAGPEIWGGIAVYGSGWSAPAGAFATGPGALAHMFERIVQAPGVRSLVHEGRYDDGLSAVNELLDETDGLERARLLELKAELVWRKGRCLCPSADRAEALELLADARFCAETEQDEALARRIEATWRKLSI